jgi:hypothetical protein
MFRRFATILVFAMWMGGFTFYAEIVIPTATHVLGSGRHVGFITEQVTNWLNLIGIAALAVFLWNLIAEWPHAPKNRKRLLAAAWGTMVAADLGLFATHPLIDHLLDTKARRILDFDRFDTLHTVYLTFATTQWIAALVYIWFSFRAWQDHDKRMALAGAGAEKLSVQAQI